MKTLKVISLGLGFDSYFLWLNDAILFYIDLIDLWYFLWINLPNKRIFIKLEIEKYLNILDIF